MRAPFHPSACAKVDAATYPAYPLRTVSPPATNCTSCQSTPASAKAARAADYRVRAFLKKYFSLRARAGLKTQQSVAKKSGLRRSYVAVVEAGDHFPQQKTLQRLAKAFGVDVSELLP